MIHVALIAKPGNADSGVGRYCVALAEKLRASGLRVTLVHPTPPLPGWLSRALRHTTGWDLEAFFANYPVWARYPAADLYHIGSQNLATLMLFRRPPGPTVITVHDILPHLLRHDPQLSGMRHALDRAQNRVAMWGLRRADHLLAVSDYTRRCLVGAFGLPPAQVSLTREGVSAGREAIAPPAGSECSVWA